MPRFMLCTMVDKVIHGDGSIYDAKGKIAELKLDKECFEEMGLKCSIR